MSTTAPADRRQIGTEIGPQSLFTEEGWPAWLTSVGLHLLLLMSLWFIKVSADQADDLLINSAIQKPDPLHLDTDAFQIDTVVVDQVGNDSPLNTLDPTAGTAADAAQSSSERILEKHEAVQRQLEETVLQVDIPTTNSAVAIAPADSELATRVDVTGTTEHAGGVEGAIDRLTFEIASSLKESPTFVVWLFDASLSLKKRRAAIADRFENVYKQLGIMNVGGGGALKTAIASYGKSTNILTPEPVDDVEDIKDAVRNIESDESGIENVFAAVSEVTKKWLSFRTNRNDRRNMLIIIITDERGDDYAVLEEAIHTLRRYGIRVYCVGNAAVFGHEKGYVPWEYPDGFTEYLPVDQGPETAAPERLQLAYWGRRGRDLENLSATFGPYALTRLCAETGGMFFVSEEIPGPKFDPEVMRKYQPDYRPLRDYDQQLSQNAAKGALVRAAVATKAEAIPQPQFVFRADTDTALRQQISEAQKPLAVLDYKLEEMLTLLESGEKDRSQLTTPRWRASYDLALGRVLAMRARAYGYNVILADMKVAPKTFQDPQNNTWVLVPAEEGTAGPRIDKLVQKAKEYLNRVVEEHPGTPWEILAKEELSQPMGWQWKERYVNYPPPPENNPNTPPPDAPRRRMSQPAPRAKPQL